MYLFVPPVFAPACAVPVGHNGSNGHPWTNLLHDSPYFLSSFSLIHAHVVVSLADLGHILQAYLSYL